ncbi:MAG: GNAT family N-acetyltransferase [Spirulina sp.]
MYQPVEIKRVKDGKWIQAVIVPIAPNHVRDYEEHWQPLLENLREEDKYWDWALKKRIALQDDNFEIYALECEGLTQGLMELETQWHRSQIDESDRIVYIEYLASAPWNRTNSKTQRIYSGIGKILLEFARQRSLDLGYGGRVSLHALLNAVRFYESQNMSNYGADPDKDNLDYFEYSRIE